MNDLFWKDIKGPCRVYHKWTFTVSSYQSSVFATAPYPLDASGVRTEVQRFDQPWAWFPTRFIVYCIWGIRKTILRSTRLEESEVRDRVWICWKRTWDREEKCKGSEVKRRAVKREERWSWSSFPSTSALILRFLIRSYPSIMVDGWPS